MNTVLKTLALVAALAAGPAWTPAHAATQADVDELVSGLELPVR